MSTFPILFVILSLLSFNEKYVLSIQDGNVTEQHHTTRCICKCKRNRINPSDTVFIESPFLDKSNCTCTNVVLPKTDLEAEQSNLYCLNCHCQYEVRSLIKIQISVAIVIAILSCLIMYGCCLVFLQPLVKKPRNIEKDMYSVVQQSSDNATAYETFGVYDSLGGHINDSYSTSPLSKLILEGKFTRVINMQSRWKEQLEVQRRKIYNSTSS